MHHKHKEGAVLLQPVALWGGFGTSHLAANDGTSVARGCENTMFAGGHNHSRSKEKSLAHRVANFLLHYRNARHARTEASPVQLMIGRDLRSRLHLLRPDLQG